MRKDRVYNTTQGFEMPLEHIPVESDMALLTSGDTDVVNNIITGLLNYTTNVVRSYVVQIPAAKPYEEDLIAEATMVLTEFVVSKVGKPEIAPTSFMAQATGAIKNRVNDWVRENENTISIPAREQRRSNKTMKRHEVKEHHAVSGEDEVFDTIWVEEVTDHLSEEELAIARLRMEGCSVNKICTELGLHRGKVQRILSDIERQFNGERL